MITREQCLKWAEEVSLNFAHRANTEDVEALCQRVWNEAIEAAALEVDHIYRAGGGTQGDEIRSLKVTQGCTHNCNQGRSCTCQKK